MTKKEGFSWSSDTLIYYFKYQARRKGQTNVTAAAAIEVQPAKATSNNKHNPTIPLPLLTWIVPWCTICSFFSSAAQPTKGILLVLLTRLKISTETVKNVFILGISTYWHHNALAASSISRAIRSCIIRESPHSLRTKEIQVWGKLLFNVL